MSKGISILFITLSCMVLVSCSKAHRQCNNHDKTSHDSIESSDNHTTFSIPKYANHIIKSYPSFNIKYSDNKLVFEDGYTIVCDDGKDKEYKEMLDDCDIEDMFSMSYDTTSIKPSYLNDCGRGRNEKLFKKMYGGNEVAAKKNLVKVDWFGQKILFTSINGAAKQLSKVASELSEKPNLRKYLINASSFYWRKVRGANRQSAHSYGIAIDLNTSYSNYWLWSNPKSTETDVIKYENRIPIEIVRIFEKHGFIWGGRWYHYDTMHFEYRPELII